MGQVEREGDPPMVREGPGTGLLVKLKIIWLIVLYDVARILYKYGISVQVGYLSGYTQRINTWASFQGHVVKSNGLPVARVQASSE